MAEVKFINHKGKKILLMDFAYSKPEEMLLAVEDAKRTVKRLPEKSVCVLVDVRCSPFEQSLSDAVKELAAHDRPYMKVTAIVGVTGLKKLAYSAAIRFSGRKNILMFDRIENAKDWLAEQ
ncbi:MAG: hypothetical protein ABSA34_02380 [Candidatus Goldiibacteriota bacterium]|jgi:hypothetical protein